MRNDFPSHIINIPATAITAGTPVALYTPPASGIWRLVSYHLSLSVAGSVILKDAGTEVLRTPLLAAGVGQMSPNMGQGVVAAAEGDALEIDATASGNVSGWVGIALL